MELTFGQYYILLASDQGLTPSQVARQACFDEHMVEAYITDLEGKGLLQASDNNGDQIHYLVTEFGLQGLEEFELYNPTLTINQPVA